MRTQSGPPPDAPLAGTGEESRGRGSEAAKHKADRLSWRACASSDAREALADVELLQKHRHAKVMRPARGCREREGCQDKRPLRPRALQGTHEADREC